MKKFDYDYYHKLNSQAIDVPYLPTLLKKIEADKEHLRENLSTLFHCGENEVFVYMEDVVSGKGCPSVVKLFYYFGSFDINNHEHSGLLNEILPISGHSLLVYLNGGKHNVNPLIHASLEARANSSPEFFAEYCKEIELFSLVHQGFHLNNDSSDLIVKAVLENNKNYKKSSSVQSGYFLLNARLLQQEIESIGINNFLQNLNEVDDEGEFSNFMNNIHFAKELLLEISDDEIIKLINGVNDIDKSQINQQLLGFVYGLLEKNPEIRKSTRIIEHLPDIDKNRIVRNIYANENLIYDEYVAFAKVANFELGINKFPEYLLSSRNMGFFTSEREKLNFVIEYFKSQSEIEQNDAVEFYLLNFLNDTSFRNCFDSAKKLRESSINPLKKSLFATNFVYYSRSGSMSQLLQACIKAPKVNLTKILNNSPALKDLTIENIKDATKYIVVDDITDMMYTERDIAVLKAISEKLELEQTLNPVELEIHD